MCLNAFWYIDLKHSFFLLQEQDGKLEEAQRLSLEAPVYLMASGLRVGEVIIELDTGDVLQYAGTQVSKECSRTGTSMYRYSTGTLQVPGTLSQTSYIVEQIG
jgi:hypothetical protein